MISVSVEEDLLQVDETTEYIFHNPTTEIMILALDFYHVQNTIPKVW